MSRPSFAASTTAITAAGREVPDDNGAAASLSENALADDAPIGGRKSSLRDRLDKLATTEMPGAPAPKVPDRSDLWSLRAMYAEPLWAIARPYAHRTAEEVSALIGWDPLSPAPPAGHPLHEVGYPACLHASETALVPYVHDAHIREIDAFRRIALGKPFDKPTA